ncbi:hypothetical protein [Aestuariibaculum sediminum]|uniref:Lipoprotein n=1 Tax=Aestuariibaculum sediminum TaxID=2770637 RepID=A0A8J6U8X1_9FLAO|nr:hypothetical protein [Aestuariibaculum sediminum]MBD0832262.1 hypothetical protein [Aestuariibaculum sediminum]
MKTLKFITSLVLTALLTLTSCQDEISEESGLNPNTNTANSAATNNFKRTAMYDGSFDDFLDGMSCSSVLFPVTATINNTEITLLSQLDYTTVINILGEFTNDDDAVVFKFPIRVKLSNYTEVEIKNQSEYDALMETCNEAEQNAEDAINCLEIDYPVTVLTFNINAEQTGSFVLQSNQELYSYMNNMNNDERYSIEYPFTATANGDSVVEITSDLDLQTRIEECSATEDTIEEAEENAKNLEVILADSTFKIESLIVAGIDTTNELVDYTIEFSNDLTVIAKNTTETVQGTYMVSSELDVILAINFTGNTQLEILNNNWVVKSFNENQITLESSTTTAIKLILTKV